MALAEAWNVVPTAAGVPVPVTAWICLNASQKLVASPPAGTADGGADVGATVAGDGVVVWLAAVGDVVFVELATLLDPDEHPASAATRTNIRESRRIVFKPHPWVGYLSAR
jgi:hypothetical protein